MDKVLELDVDVEAENVIEATLDFESGSDVDLDMVIGEGSGVPYNYEDLMNKPRIEGTVLEGDKTLPQIGVGTITPQDIDDLIYGLG